MRARKYGKNQLRASLRKLLMPVSKNSVLQPVMVADISSRIITTSIEHHRKRSGSWRNGIAMMIAYRQAKGAVTGACGMLNCGS